MRKQKTTIPTAHVQTENNNPQCAYANRKQQSLLHMRKLKIMILTAHAQTENNDPYCACANRKQ